MRRGAWLLLCAACAACQGGGKGDQGAADGEDDAPAPSVLCSIAPELKPGGEVSAFDIEWTYDEADGISLGVPIMVSVGEDIGGITMTVDAGSVKSGVATLIMNDVYVLDWTGQAEPGDPASRGQVGDSADTAADTAWDTSWHTGALQDTGEPGHGWGAEPFFHYLEVAGTVKLPMNEQTKPIAGCMMVIPAALGDQRGEIGTLYVAGKRAEDAAADIDLNLWIVDGAGITQGQVETALEQVRHVYGSAAGPELGEVRFMTMALEDGPYVKYEGEDIDAMRRTLPDTEQEHEAMNLFFIADFLGGGTFGIAAGIPGPYVQGTAGSGVTMAIEPHRDADGVINTRVLGETIAHEVGHQLGLFHTSESDGESHDVIADTPMCTRTRHDTNNDGSLTADECEEFGGTNFMFWKSADYAQDQMSPGQAFVLNRSPLAQ